jgi:hypothetical protein
VPGLQGEGHQPGIHEETARPVHAVWRDEADAADGLEGSAQGDPRHVERGQGKQGEEEIVMANSDKKDIIKWIKNLPPPKPKGGK